MVSKSKIIETFCGLNLKTELQGLPNDEFENSMIAETPEVFALLAEKINDDKNELELKKIELSNALELEKTKIQCEFTHKQEIARINASERISHHNYDVMHKRLHTIEKSFIAFICCVSALGILFFLT